MEPFEQIRTDHSRRTFLATSTASVGAAAFASLFQPSPLSGRERPADVGSDRWRGIIRPPHYPPRAKRVIHLCMAGGASHLETFDPKPELVRLHGKPMPESFTTGQPIAQLQGRKLSCFAPQFPFTKSGESGLEIASVFPHLQGIADDLCIIRSTKTEQINHDPAHTYFNTGRAIAGLPSMGAWVLYGLGSESEELPGFIVLTSKGGGQSQPIAARQWHSGFLPSRFQGVQFNSTGDPVHYVRNPSGVGDPQQRDVIDAVNRIDTVRDRQLHNPEIAARISQYELAFRMQASVPDLMDVSGEPQHILDMYGATPGDGSYASNCLLARRLAERGVRFIQLYHRGWDHHGGIKKGVEAVSKLVDQPTAALINDLKRRGMFQDTLLVWSGEFGRTPMAQGDGRDHHIKGFSIWMAGGGIRGGMCYGATDDLGYNAVEDVFHIRDFHATMLYLLGIDHKRFRYPYRGLDLGLTGVEPARVVKEIMA
ncbi:MAG: DUF1501 domain-containing protein [Pirellulales bacterium]